MVDVAEAAALAERLADAAAAEIRGRFRSLYKVERKADVTPVTEADRAAEQAIRAILAAERPDDAVAGEEFGVTPGQSGLTWVIDPIDGTTSFMSGKPTFVTLIALLDGDRPVMGLINQPVTGDRWVGAVGRPTTLNGAPIRTRDCTDLATAYFSTTAPELFRGEGDAAVYRALAAGAGLRTYGSDGYAYGLLASGWIDVVLESGLKLHDFAALVPVVEGAGGKMSDWDGAPLGSGSSGRVLAVGSAALHAEVLRRIRAVRADHLDS